jgi:arylsulfatase A-like enzyme
MTESARRPNIVLIMCDQLRADFLSLAGFPLPTTPALDSWAAGGVTFGRAYTSSPLCTPARASLLTGRFPHAHGLRGNYPRGVRFDYDLEQVLHRLGYHVALVGKNHSYLRPEQFDFQRPYSHAFAPPRGLEPVGGTGMGAGAVPADEFTRWLRRLNHGVATEPTPFPLEDQYPVRIVDESIAHLQQRRAQAPDQPFFLWMSFPEPHNPYQVPAPYFDLFPPDAVPDRAAGPEVLARKPFPWAWERDLMRHVYPNVDDLWRRARSNYCGMVRLIDDQLARFFAYLEGSGLAETTHVIFLADHGDYVGEYGLLRKGVGLPECLIRMPLIWRGPGIAAGRREDTAHVSIVDVFPTLCEILEVPLPVGVQGRSLLPLLRGEPYPAEEFASILVEVGLGGLPYTAGDADEFGFEDRTAYHPPAEPGGAPTFDELNSLTLSGRLKAVRAGDWKLIYDWQRPREVELYCLRDDPAELQNRATDPSPEPQINAQQLFADLLRWTIRTEDDWPLARYRLKRHPRNWLFTGEGRIEPVPPEERPELS